MEKSRTEKMREKYEASERIDKIETALIRLQVIERCLNEQAGEIAKFFNADTTLRIAYSFYEGAHYHLLPIEGAIIGKWTKKEAQTLIDLIRANMQRQKQEYEAQL